MGPDMDKIVRQVAMDGLPSGQTRIISELAKANEKLDRILKLLEEKKDE